MRQKNKLNAPYRPSKPALIRLAIYLYIYIHNLVSIKGAYKKTFGFVWV